MKNSVATDGIEHRERPRDTTNDGGTQPLCGHAVPGFYAPGRGVSFTTSES